MANGKANCRLSLDSCCAKSPPGPPWPGCGLRGARFLFTLLDLSIQSAEAFNRTRRTRSTHPGAEDSIRIVATRGPGSSIAILTGPLVLTFDVSLPSRNRY